VHFWCRCCFFFAVCTTAPWRSAWLRDPSKF
jgi:hypothetical protein